MAALGTRIEIVIDLATAKYLTGHQTELDLRTYDLTSTRSEQSACPCQYVRGTILTQDGATSSSRIRFGRNQFL